MPKKPRQAHIPQQSKRRRARRPAAASPSPTATEPAPRFVEEPVLDALAYTGRRGPVANPASAAPPAPIAPPARARRRLEVLRAPQEVSSARAIPGQLPTFERAYLMRELRQISVTASGLLAIIILLAILLR